MDEFHYFMVRVRSDPNAARGVARDSLNGIVEQLGSGEKRAFTNPPELVELLTAWPDGSANMQPGFSPGNADT
jgi:hypothetical protein